MCSIGSYFTLKDGCHLQGMSEHFDSHSLRWARVADFIRFVARGEPTITSAHDGKHSQNSMHYQGKAVDLRIRDWEGQIVPYARTIAFMLGEPWVVIIEVDHLHIQLGTQNIKAPQTLEVINGAGFGRSVK